MILKSFSFFSFAAAMGFSFLTLTNPSIAHAQQPHRYQCTGQLRELTDSMITLEKDQEVWQIVRDANTKLNSDVKTGDRITVQYVVMAVTVEDKPEPVEQPAVKSGKNTGKKTKKKSDSSLDSGSSGE